MRYLSLVNVLLLCSLCVHGEEVSKLECQKDINLLSYCSEEIFKSIYPNDNYRRENLISISIITSNYRKLVLQTNGKNFELYDGILKPGIIAQLDELNKTCRLPESPYNIRSVLKVNWERIIIEPNKFEEIHNAFIKALEELAMKIRHRYNPLIETGNYYIPVHVPTYTIIYDNHTEHIEIYGEDVEDAEGRFNPVIEWVKTIKIIAGDEPFGDGPEITD